MLKDRISNEPPLEVEQEQANFLDDAFGEGVVIEGHLNEAEKEYKVDVTKMANKNLGQKAKAQLAKKAEYKEQVMAVLQHRGLHSMWLRMAFWVNKLIHLLHMPK